MLNYFGVWCYGFSFPSSCVWVPQVQTDRRKLSKQTCQLHPLSVSRQDCQKGKALFLKDFQNFGILSFEKSVEEMTLRAKVFTFGDLDSLSVWFSLMVEKEGDLLGEKWTFKE